MRLMNMTIAPRSMRFFGRAILNHFLKAGLFIFAPGGYRLPHRAVRHACGCLAQLVERLTLNQLVVGSIPTAPTIFPAIIPLVLSLTIGKHSAAHTPPAGRQGMAQETRDQVKQRMNQRKGPSWAAKHNKPSSGFQMVFVVILAIAVVLAVFRLLVFNQPDKPAYIPPLAASSPPAQPVQAAPPAAQAISLPAAQQAKPPEHALAPQIPIPADETQFVSIVAAAAHIYTSGASATAKDAAQHQRAQAICQAFPVPHVSQWVGIVETASSTATGATILAVALDVKKASESAGASSSPSILILASPPFLPAPSQINAGDTVTFSGKFAPDNTGQNCFQDGSQTTDQAMQSPAFLMQLSDVKEAQ
jgi:hypothetical protein